MTTKITHPDVRSLAKWKKFSCQTIFVEYLKKHIFLKKIELYIPLKPYYVITKISHPDMKSLNERTCMFTQPFFAEYHKTCHFAENENRNHWNLTCHQ